MRGHVERTQCSWVRFFPGCERVTIGLDLGDRSGRYCMLDERGEVLSESSVVASLYGSRPPLRILTCPLVYPPILHLPRPVSAVPKK